MVYQIAYGILRNERDAEDVAQETFIRAHAKLASLRDRENFRAWVTQIVRRLALNRLRSETRARHREERAYAAESHSPTDVETIAADRIFVRRVRDEIQRLPDKLRDVMLLTAIDGLGHADVARMLAIPEGTVRSRLHLARKALLKVLDI